ncbi:hypothetical protein L9F63_022585 [Diploptera punctata]|uniref:CRAL-TRIO domain-containing protein n=1 Tax=Diploptera punctata TaxID=6984 RepID=A0AAD8EAF2_DIPPU|nr:hypothetical protein L9F63_022585 [Diploptera punctata]
MDKEILPTPTTETIKIVRNEYGLTDSNISKSVDIIHKWLTQQPHLPDETDNGRLERWLLRCKNSIETTKRTLDMYYALKGLVPEIMYHWDTKSEWFSIASKLFFEIPLPTLTPDRDRVLILGLQTPDTRHFDPVMMYRITLMILEIRMMEDYCRSDVIILDFNNYSLAHLPHVSLPRVKKYEMCIMRAYKVRIKAVHMLNVPPFAEHLISLFKSILKTKLASRIQVHSGDMAKFYKQVPKEILPAEYGGEAGSVLHLWGSWVKKLECYQNWFLKHQELKSDEKKRPGKMITSTDLFGFEGSFRKLDVD